LSFPSFFKSAHLFACSIFSFLVDHSPQAASLGGRGRDEEFGFSYKDLSVFFCRAGQKVRVLYQDCEFLHEEERMVQRWTSGKEENKVASGRGSHVLASAFLRRVA
jgi:hypothetical protein